MSSFGLFAIGYLFLLAGLLYAAAYIFNLPMQWIILGGLVLLGLGVMKAVSKTRKKDTPN